MKYSEINGIHIVEAPASDIKVIMVDAAKKSAASKNYCNAGFFAYYSEGGTKFTLPVAHVVCDYKASNSYTKMYCKERGKFSGTKFTFDCGAWLHDRQFSDNAVSTLILKDGIASVQDLKTLPSCDYAISGVPIMRGGKDVTFTTYVRQQGFDASVLYSTYHIFVGIKEASAKTLFIMCMKTRTGNMITTAEAYRKFKALGFYDVIKLDGGGSTHFNVDGVAKVSTAENRIINTIITF